jgi:hypothetical protein
MEATAAGGVDRRRYGRWEEDAGEMARARRIAVVAFIYFFQRINMGR